MNCNEETTVNQNLGMKTEANADLSNISQRLHPTEEEQMLCATVALVCCLLQGMSACRENVGPISILHLD